MAFSEEWYETELKSSELETLHRPPTVEYSFYTAVKTGDMETVVANCKEDAFIHLEGTGVLSRNTLTNIKYHFVVTAAMLTRYCIDGGLEPEQAYRLSDFYILKMDTCTTVRQIRIFTMKWLKTLPARWFFRKKVPSYPSRSYSVWIIFTVISKNALPSPCWQNIPDYPRAISPGYSNRTSAFPSVTISARKK